MWLLALSFAKAAPARVQVFLSLAGAVLIAIGVAFLKGRAAGTANYLRRREREKLKSAETSREIRDEVRNDNDARLDRRLDRWMRK